MPETLIDVVEKTNVLDKKPENISRVHKDKEEYRQRIEVVQTNDHYEHCSDQD